MFDSSHWWYTEMERELLKKRLSALSLDQLVVYAVGCVTHASEAIRGDVTAQELAEFQPIALLLDLFWHEYPQTASGLKLASIASKAEEIVMSELGPEPDEKFFEAPGAEPLLWSTLYALTLAANPTPIVPAYSAVGRSYYAVYARYSSDKQAVSEGRMKEVEKATPQCVNEISFQIKFLKLLERKKSLPANYSEVSTCSGDS